MIESGPTLPRWQRMTSGVFAIAYLLSAAAQYNDPDGWLWGLFYLAAALLAGLAAAAQPKTVASAALAALAWAWTLSLLPDFIGKVSSTELFDSLTMKTRAVEEAREAGGAALVALWMTVLGSALFSRLKH